MATKSKKVFVAFSNPGSDQSLFFKLYSLGKGTPTSGLMQPDLAPAMAKVAEELQRYAAQMRNQQDHIDEIKRLCHVPTG